MANAKLGELTTAADDAWTEIKTVFSKPSTMFRNPLREPNGISKTHAMIRPKTKKVRKVVRDDDTDDLSTM